MEDVDFLKQQEKLEKISSEIKRLGKLFAGMDLKTRKAIQPLIEKAAFMSATLDELQEDINREGVVETYQNGANQSGVKKSSKVEVYNAMIKNYSGVMKQLTDLLPKPSAGAPSGQGGEQKEDGIPEFVKRRNEMQQGK
jgi:cysteinyl-tRNA synthetase